MKEFDSATVWIYISHINKIMFDFTTHTHTKKKTADSPSISNPFDVTFAETTFTDPFSCFSGIVPFYNTYFNTECCQKYRHINT